MNPNCGIYAITGPNGRQYIGQSVSIHRRWGEHKSHLRCGIHHCRSLQNAFNKYGEAAFSFSIIAVTEPRQLNDVEQFEIDRRPRYMLYNEALFVVASMKGRRHTLESREKMSRSLLGMDPERKKAFRENLSKLKTGSKHSAEVREKMSISAKNRGPQARANMARNGEANANWGRTGSKHPRSRSVMCINSGMIFESCEDAAKWLRWNGHPKAQKCAISWACSGKFSTAYKQAWCYLEDYKGDDKYWLTTPAMPVTLETAFCAAEPMATEAFDHIEDPADVAGVT